jgi:hypothetical protein
VRATKDIDICPDPADANLRRLAATLAELDAKAIGLGDFAGSGELDLEPNLEGLKMGGNWTLTTKHGRLDAMRHLDGLGKDGGVRYPIQLAGHQSVTSRRHAQSSRGASPCSSAAGLRRPYGAGCSKVCW